MVPTCPGTATHLTEWTPRSASATANNTNAACAGVRITSGPSGMHSQGWICPKLPPPDYTPAAPESVRSWSSDEHSDAWSGSQSPLLWADRLCEAQDMQRLLSEGGQEDTRRRSGSTYRVASGPINDAWTPPPPPRGLGEHPHIPAPPQPPSCPLAWPQTPLSPSMDWDTEHAEHNAQLATHGAVCAACGDATGFGSNNLSLVAGRWPRRSEGQERLSITPVVATERRRANSWPGSTSDRGGHNITPAPHCEYLTLDLTTDSELCTLDGRMSHHPGQGYDELPNDAKWRDDRSRLSLTSIRRSLSINGAIINRRRGVRTSFILSPAGTASPSSSATSGYGDSTQSSPYTKERSVSPLLENAQPFQCEADDAGEESPLQRPLVAPTQAHSLGPAFESRPSLGTGEGMRGTGETWPGCEGPALHGSSHDPSPSRYYSPLGTSHPSDPYHCLYSPLSYASAHRELPSVPASPGADSMDFELVEGEYDPDHFERRERFSHDESDRFPRPASPCDESLCADAGCGPRPPTTLPAWASNVDGYRSGHGPVRHDSPCSLSSGTGDRSGSSGLNGVIRDSFQLDGDDFALRFTSTTPFVSCTSLAIPHNTVADLSPTLPPSSLPSPPVALAALPLPPAPAVSEEDTLQPVSFSPTFSSPSSGAATPQGHDLLTPLDELSSHFQTSLSDGSSLYLDEMIPVLTRGTQPLRLRQSPGRSPKRGQSPSSSVDMVSLATSHSATSDTQNRPHDKGKEKKADEHGSQLSDSPLSGEHHSHTSSGDGIDIVEQPPTPQHPLDYRSHRHTLPPTLRAASNPPPPPSAPLPSLPPQARPVPSSGPPDHNLYSARSPHDEPNTPATRRDSSRYSQSTQTSFSSDGSKPTTPPSSRHHTAHSQWAAEHRKAVSTVVEEDSVDQPVLSGYDPDYETSISLGYNDKRSHSTSSPISRHHHHPSKGHSHRSSTVSTSSSTAAKQVNTHPFAYRRGSSSSGSDSLGMLAIPRQQAISSSQSYPSLYDDYKRINTDVAKNRHVALVTTEENVNEIICPVCCESLKNRLPGEKPHIVPECGHGLHEECFRAVYGDVPPEGSRKNIGVCGVCRRPMRMPEGGTERGNQKRNKLVALMGSQGSHSGSSSSEAEDVTGDDPVEGSQAPSSASGRSAELLKVVVPNISIKSEQPSVRRSQQNKQTVTCMVTIEVPEASDTSLYPARSRQIESLISPGLPPSPHSATSVASSRDPGSATLSSQDPSSPFASVATDLRRRVVDYRSQGLDVIGQLKLFDILPVRKGSDMGDFHLYLFQGALVCITEERKSTGTFRNLFAGSGSKNGGQNGSTARSVLKVKGLIHHLHVREVQDTSTTSEYSIELTVDTENRVDKFQICFKDSSSHEMWKGTLRRLVDDANVPWSANRDRMSSTASQSNHRSSRLMAPSSLFEPPESIVTCAGQCPGDLAYRVPIAPHHTPLDLVIVISSPATAKASSAALPLKQRLMRSSLQFVLACMGPKDRISIVSSESGENGTVRKTPLLNATNHDSRLKLENFIDGLGLGRLDNDEFEVAGFADDHQDVVAAINVGLDVVLGRKAKNPITGLLLISDTNDHLKREHLDLVNARLDAAKVQVHAFGYGKAHDPSPLWVASNHTHGTYTFVKEWYHLRDALAGVLGGLMSTALTNMKLRLTCQDPSFRVAKVSGLSQAIISSNGKEVDVELQVLRHNERREFLVEFELVDPNAPSGARSPTSGSNHRTSVAMSPTNSEDGRSQHAISRSQGMSPGQQSFSQAADSARRPSIHGGYDILSLNENYTETHEEVPVVEVDCSFHDPLAGRSASRLSSPVLLTLPVLPHNAPAPATMGEPSIIRRRMELLTSEMMTRAMMAASRRNFSQAKLTLRETKRIVEKMADDMRRVISQNPPTGSRSRREMAFIQAVEGLAATMQDIDSLLDGLEEVNVDISMFDIDYRNYAAQQAVILRTQRSWTVRTPTELLYATSSVRSLIQAGTEYASVVGQARGLDTVNVV